MGALDGQPFGHGRPYSRASWSPHAQALFSPEAWTEALLSRRCGDASSCDRRPAWERVGSALPLPFAGVHVVDATKQVYRPVLVRRPNGEQRRGYARMRRPTPVVRVALARQLAFLLPSAGRRPYALAT